MDVVTEGGETLSKDGLYIRDRERGLLDVMEEIKLLDKQQSELTKQKQILDNDLKSKMSLWENLATSLDEEKTTLETLKEARILKKTKLDALQQNREANLKRVRVNKSEIDLLQLEKIKIEEEIQKLDTLKEEEEGRRERMNKQQASLRLGRDQLEQELSNQDKKTMEKEHGIHLINEKQNSTRSRIKELESAISKMSATVKQNSREEESLKKELSQMAEAIASQLEENDVLINKKGECEKKIGKQEKDFDHINQQLKAKTQGLSTSRKVLEEVKETRNDLEIKFSSIKRDIYQIEDKAFKELNAELDSIEEPENYKEIGIAELEKDLETFDMRLARMRDSDRLNFSAESEYDLLSKDFNFLQSQREDVLLSIQDMNAAITKIDEESRSSFLKAYSEINEYYKKNFKILFEGGEAELSLTDKDNINETGLEIKAQPPGKKLQGLRLLSGGEKALTSLAFLFSLFEYKPSPFCVFDEVDASLDEANIQRFLNFLHKLKEKTQFLIITHNFKTMEEADYIYGISMNEPGISTIYSMKLSGKDQLIPNN